MKFFNLKSGFFHKIRKHSIATRLLLFFTVAMIVPYFVVIVLLYDHFRAASINTVGMNMQDAMISVAEQINDRMKEKETASLSIYYDGCAGLLPKDSLSAEEKKVITDSLKSYIYANFIRELLKPLPATERSLLEAKVPSVKRRTSCVYADLKELSSKMSSLKAS